MSITLTPRQREVLGALREADDWVGRPQVTAFMVHRIAGGALRSAAGTLTYLIRCGFAERVGAGTPVRYKITRLGRSQLQVHLVGCADAFWTACTQAAEKLQASTGQSQVTCEQCRMKIGSRSITPGGFALAPAHPRQETS